MFLYENRQSSSYLNNPTDPGGPQHCRRTPGRHPGRPAGVPHTRPRRRVATPPTMPPTHRVQKPPRPSGPPGWARWWCRLGWSPRQAGEVRQSQHASSFTKCWSGLPCPIGGTFSLQGPVPKRRRHHTPTFQGRSIQVGPADDAHTNHFYVGEDHPVHGAFRYSITRMNP